MKDETENGTTVKDGSSRRRKQRGIKIDFLQDPVEEMTYNRRIALYLAANYEWYTKTPKFKQAQELQEDHDANSKNEKDDEVNEIIDGNGDQQKPSQQTTAPPELVFDPDQGIMAQEEEQEVVFDPDTKEDQIIDSKTHLAAEGLQKALNAEAFAYPFVRSPNEEPPSLSKAWAYFEHNTLARFKVIDEDEKQEHVSRSRTSRVVRKKPFVVKVIDALSKGQKKLERAQPGEDTVKTRLYSPLWTPQRQLGDFGIGIGLLFSNQRAIGTLCLLAVFLNVRNFRYFNSDDYNGDDSAHGNENNSWLLRRSAVCSNYGYVPCIGCKESDFHDTRVAYAYNVDDAREQDFFFAIKNYCNFDENRSQAAIINIATMILFAIGFIVIYRYTRWQAKVFDEDEETAQDYSIVIQNPPRNAKNPDEWKAFFEGLKSELGPEASDLQVKACTIGVDNDELIKRLTERREKLRAISALIDPGISLEPETLERLSKIELKRREDNPSMMPRLSPGIPELLQRIRKLNTKILYLTKRSYDVSTVFVTFEKERHKRVVLEMMGLDLKYTRKNDGRKLPNSKFLFRSNKVLLVREAEEPAAVKWKDLNTSYVSRRYITLATSLMTCLSLYLAVQVVDSWKNLGLLGSSMLITIFNAVFPMIAKPLTNMEGHHSESARQRSLYFKITFFLVGNLFYATWTTTPFTSTIANPAVDPNGLVVRLNTLFYSEITMGMLLQGSDYMGLIKRHILAPRAKTQEDMNFNMSGGGVEIAERYTSMTKLLFLALWGSSVYPGGLFMCWVAMGVKYWLDRLSLMRHWKRVPETGPETAELTNKYVFAFATVMMAVVSALMWLGFPYDNLCDHDVYDTVPEEYHGSWTIRPKIPPKDPGALVKWLGWSPDEDEVQVFNQTTPAYRYCLQDRRRRPGSGEDDGRLFEILFYTSFGAIVVCLIYFCCLGCISCGKLYKYRSHGEDQERGYSELDEGIGIYIPQVHSNQFNYPLLACRSDNLKASVIEWNDPDRDYSYYDMTKDVERLLLGDILRLCDDVMGVKPEVLLRGLVEKQNLRSSLYNREDDDRILQEEMANLLRQKAQLYFQKRSIFSIVREWHHCEIEESEHVAMEKVDEDLEVVQESDPYSDGESC